MKSVAGKTIPAFPAHAHRIILRIWQEAHTGLLPWHWRNSVLVLVQWSHPEVSKKLGHMKQPIPNNITTKEQSTTKPCKHFMGIHYRQEIAQCTKTTYRVLIFWMLWMYRSLHLHDIEFSKLSASNVLVRRFLYKTIIDLAISPRVEAHW